MSRWFQSQAADFYDTGYKIKSHGMIIVTIPKVTLFKNSSILAVSVPINLSIMLAFVSVSGPGETNILYALLKFSLDFDLFELDAIGKYR